MTTETEIKNAKANVRKLTHQKRLAKDKVKEAKAKHDIIDAKLRLAKLCVFGLSPDDRYVANPFDF